MNIDRTRVVFFAIVGLALVIVCGVLGYNFANGYLNQRLATPVPADTVQTVIRNQYRWVAGAVHVIVFVAGRPGAL